MGLVRDFLSIFVFPSKVLKKIDKETRGLVSTFSKLFIGFGLSMVASAIAFLGVLFLEVWFWVTGAMGFTIGFFVYPIYAALIIPIIFWLLDTIFLLLGVLIVGVKPNMIGLMNLRAFSLAPIPIKVLYIFYVYKSMSIRYLIGIPNTIISALISLWTILLLAKGIKNFFNTDYGRAIVAAIVPFVMKILIIIVMYGF